MRRKRWSPSSHAHRPRPCVVTTATIRKSSNPRKVCPASLNQVPSPYCHHFLPADTVFKIDVKGSNDPLANRAPGLMTTQTQPGGEKPNNNNKATAAALNNNKHTS